MSSPQAKADTCSAQTASCLSRFSNQRAAGVVGAARCGALETPASQRGHSRQGGWRLDEVADAEMSHVRDSFGTVVITEFGSAFLAGVHSGDPSATRVMGCPLGDVVNFSRDDDVWRILPEGQAVTVSAGCKPALK